MLSTFNAEQRELVSDLFNALADLREAVAMHLRYLDSVEEKLRYPVPDTEVAANILMQQKRNLRQSAEKHGTLDAPRTTHFETPKRRRRKKAA